MVNCGGISYASYRLVSIIEEICQNYYPDLLIIYAGHNEFLEDRTYDHIKNISELVPKPVKFVSQLRTYSYLKKIYKKWKNKSSNVDYDKRPELPAIVEAELDYEGGLEKYHRDLLWKDNVVAQFKYNLDKIIKTANKYNTQILILNPGSNIRDFSPF